MTSKDDTATVVSDNVFSAPFTAMAKRIDHNSDAGFGGAAVLIGPDGGKVELLLIDAHSDPAQFWATVASRIELIVGGLKDSNRQMQAFQRR